MYSEWLAYEIYAGPIGPKYGYELQRASVELLRSGNYMAGARFKNNPVPRPSTPFPSEVEYMNPEPEQDEEEMNPDDVMDIMDTLVKKEES